MKCRRGSLLTEASVYLAVLSVMGSLWITRAKASVEAGNEITKQIQRAQKDAERMDEEVRRAAWRRP